jgi:hypothetical protein
MKFIRALCIIIATPLALCIGIYGCTAAHIAALTH